MTDETTRRIATITIVISEQGKSLLTQLSTDLDEEVLRSIDPSGGVMFGAKLMAINLAAGTDDHILDIIRMCGTREDIERIETTIFAVGMLYKSKQEAENMAKKGGDDGQEQPKNG